MTKFVRGPRQAGGKGPHFEEEMRWLSSDVRERLQTPWGAIAWPRGVPDKYMPPADKAKFIAGPAAGGTSMPGFGEDVKRLRQTWIEHRDEILAQFAKVHPGRRPRGFWLADAPEDDTAFDYLAEMGMARWGNGQPHESQASFLRRHNLLKPGEAARLRSEDFEPEEAVDADEVVGRAIKL